MQNAEKLCSVKNNTHKEVRMKLKNIVHVIASVGLITTASTQCMLPSKLKKITCSIVKKATPNIAAVLIAMPILWATQKYFCMTSKIDPRNDKDSTTKKA